MNYTNFIEKHCTNKRLDNYYEALIPVFDELIKGDPANATLVVQNKSIYEIFNSYGNKLHIFKFYDIKTFLTNLYQWLYDEGLIEQQYIDRIGEITVDDIVSDAEIKQYYFRDLDDVINSICNIGYNKDFRDYADLLSIKSVAISMWYGIEEKNVIFIKKSDLNKDEKSIIIDNRIITIEEKFFNILDLYSKTDEYRSFPTGNIFVCMPSEYLFRTLYTDQMTAGSVSTLLRRFNAVAKNSSKQLKSGCLKKNGLFVRIYQIEKNYIFSEDSEFLSIHDIIRKVTGINSKGAISNFYKEYCIWKRIFIEFEDSYEPTPADEIFLEPQEKLKKSTVYQVENLKKENEELKKCNSELRKKINELNIQKRQFEEHKEKC